MCGARLRRVPALRRIARPVPAMPGASVHPFDLGSIVALGFPMTALGRKPAGVVPGHTDYPLLHFFLRIRPTTLTGSSSTTSGTLAPGDTFSIPAVGPGRTCWRRTSRGSATTRSGAGGTVSGTRSNRSPGTSWSGHSCRPTGSPGPPAGCSRTSNARDGPGTSRSGCRRFSARTAARSRTSAVKGNSSLPAM